MIAIRRRAGARYPAPTDGFSPSVAYPEYVHGAPAVADNPVYAMVRDLLADAGLDVARRGTPAWNPLGAYIRPGDRVFVLCNFVYHRRPRETEAAFQAKIAHGSVLRALVDYVLIAAGPAGRVAFGNAPLQSCRWDDVLAQTGARAVLEFYRRAGAPVAAADLRFEITDRDPWGRVRTRTVRDPETPTVEIDLGRSSLLGAPELAAGRFRVSDYHPDRTEAFHHDGSHRYVMHRAVLDADVVISLPKLKTHEKVGITCAVKGFVGAVARKDCLAHHRFGDPGHGGDEYPGRYAFLRPLSRYHDWVNRRPDRSAAQGALQVVDRQVRRALRRLGVPGAGAWHGNDTAWRMAVDLARVVHYADAEGRLHDTPRRRHLVLIDGIVAGEGNGPLAPRAAPAGVLVLSDGVLDADRAACRLMGFEPGEVPTIAAGARDGRWSIDPPGGPSAVTILDGRPVPSESVPPVLGRPFAPPDGWRGRLGHRA
jgi:uncharacterized protein (DUF362 family)